jgi:hypothetical protein
MSDTEQGGEWGLNIGGFIKAHPGHVIRGGLEGFGWTAQAKDARGRPKGPVVADLSLDALAAKIRDQGHASG